MVLGVGRVKGFRVLGVEARGVVFGVYGVWCSVWG